MDLKIAVMGSGGVGGYFGGRLAAAGKEVAFIARGEHLEAMKKNGLSIESPLGDEHIHSIKVTNNPEKIGVVDLVLFCVKLYDVDVAAKACLPLIGPDSLIVSLQNGIDSEEKLSKLFGKERVIGGVARIPANVQRPGVIAHNGPFAGLEFAAINGETSSDLVQFEEMCRDAGIDATIVNDIKGAIWSKFAFLAPFAGVACVSRQPALRIMETPELEQLFCEALDEILAIARAKSIELSANIRDITLQTMRAFPGKPSMLHDLEKDNRLELDGLIGAIVKLGSSFSVPTPVNKTIYAALKPFQTGSRY